MDGETDGLTGNTPLYFISLSLVEVVSPSSTGEQAVRTTQELATKKLEKSVTFIGSGIVRPVL